MDGITQKQKIKVSFNNLIIIFLKISKEEQIHLATIRAEGQKVLNQNSIIIIIIVIIIISSGSIIIIIIIIVILFSN